MSSQFLELTIATEKPKALFIPTASVISYEHLPEGKAENFPKSQSFVRYDYGEGLQFAVVTETMEFLKEEIGTAGFIELHMADGAELQIQSQLIIAAREQEDEGVELTQLSLRLGGQVGSIYVKEPFAELKPILFPDSEPVPQEPVLPS